MQHRGRVRGRRAVKRQLVEEALQFHHVDPTKKLFHLGQKGLSRGIGQLREEAQKCVLLCANCHALVEAGVKEVPVKAR